MKYLRVVTPQNVELNLPLASVGQRILAYIIDQLVLLASLFFIVYAIGFTVGFDSTFMEYFTLTLVLLLLGFYSLFFEYYFNGQTPGKMLLGLRVRRADGRQPGWPELLARWFFRMPDIILTMGGLAMLLISGSEKAQRLGDIMGNTIVLDEGKNTLHDLNRIATLQTTQGYQVQFPQVGRWPEEDVILIKETLDRLQSYNNEAHQKSLDKVVSRCVHLLDLPKAPVNKEAFLKKLISDYIVLTR